eukprot:TRINITY_DN38983_c0_g1_i1.p1 TRINITY_DN38983_c0_g1~~TRINITY_DN38983_c0_g1_i1.p1  ORF type:complete len:166 (-),score=4.33 TRINITY_DN38983_c0_g1_i1:1355-1852(-)
MAHSAAVAAVILRRKRDVEQLTHNSVASNRTRQAEDDPFQLGPPRRLGVANRPIDPFNLGPKYANRRQNGLAKDGRREKPLCKKYTAVALSDRILPTASGETSQGNAAKERTSTAGSSMSPMQPPGICWRKGNSQRWEGETKPGKTWRLFGSRRVIPVRMSSPPH